RRVAGPAGHRRPQPRRSVHGGAAHRRRLGGARLFALARTQARRAPGPEREPRARVGRPPHRPLQGERAPRARTAQRRERARRRGRERTRDGAAWRCRPPLAGERVVRYVLVGRRAWREIRGDRAVVHLVKLGLSRTTTYDLPLVAVVLVLLFLGLAMVYSAS